MLKNRLSALGLGILLAFTVVTMGATAQSSPGGSGLSISPTLSEFTLKPGQSTELKITLKGAAQGAVTAQGSVTVFESDGTSGTPKLLTQPGASSPNSIKTFVKGLVSTPLQPGEQKTMALTIEVPQGTPPGAYYGVLRFKAVPGNNPTPAAGQVALTASVGSIVLITVPGNLKQQIQLEKIHVFAGSHDGSFFLTKPNKIGIEIRNLGNGFARPFGTVDVENAFGKSIANFQFNNPQQLGNILPNSTRIYSHDFNKFDRIGKYVINVNVSDDSGGQVITSTKTIWYLPIWLVLVVIAVILLLAFLAYRAYRRYARSKRHHRS